MRFALVAAGLGVFLPTPRACRGPRDTIHLLLLRQEIEGGPCLGAVSFCPGRACACIALSRIIASCTLPKALLMRTYQLVVGKPVGWQGDEALRRGLPLRLLRCLTVVVKAARGCIICLLPFLIKSVIKQGRFLLCMLGVALYSGRQGIHGSCRGATCGSHITLYCAAR